MDEVRFVKSEEEIAMFERAITLVEGALDVLEREARPGVSECAVYGRVVGWLLEQGSEPSTMFLWAAGNPVPPAVSTMASRRPLAPDDIIMVELDAKWCGYLGHGALTAWVGEADATARTMAELQFEATQRCLEAMRPGTPMEAFVKICADVAARTPFQCKPIIHGRGLGNDFPVLVFHARDERTARWQLEENSVFIVKPVVSTADGTRKVMWGDTVVVTPTGARRLGTRPAPLVGHPRS
jgi:Xaa-Pro aminopeptidase